MSMSTLIIVAMLSAALGVVASLLLVRMIVRPRPQTLPMRPVGVPAPLDESQKSTWTGLRAELEQLRELRRWLEYRSEAYRLVCPEGDPNLEQFINRLALSHVESLRHLLNNLGVFERPPSREERE